MLKAAVVFAASASISATFLSAAKAGSDELVASCRDYVASAGGTKEYAQAVHASGCIRHLSGFFDGWTTVQAITGVQKAICFPSVSYAQLVEVYVRWSDANPQQRHLTEWETVSKAYQQAFPCP